MTSNPLGESPKYPGRTTLVLFVVSFFLHAGVVLLIHHYRNPITWENGMIAQSLYEGHGFRLPHYLVLPDQLTSIQAPAYPYILVTFWRLFGETPMAYLLLSLVQCLAVASMVWPMGMLSRRWFPEAPGWIAEALVVVAPLYLWYSTRIHHTAFVMALHPWLLWAWFEWRRRGPWQSIGTGILSGIGGLFQPVLLGPYGICGVVFLSIALVKREWRTARNLILAAVTVVVCLTPWTIRNYRVHGRLILVKSGMAKEFWMGNNPHATGTAFVAGGAGEVTVVYPPKAMALAPHAREVELMDAFNAEAWAYIKAHPARTISLTADRLLWFWTLTPKNLVRSTQEGEALTFYWVQAGSWTVVVLLAILGVITARYPVREYLGALAAIAFVYSAIYGTTHVGQVRFRGEIEFIFLFGAAAGISTLLRLLIRGKAPAPASNA